MTYKDNNPKSGAGALKVPLHLVPPSATHYLATAFADGASKYGPYNWRDSGVSAMVYIGAMKRHIDAWLDGENVSQDAGVHHLAHAAACAAIILDAQSVGTLVDDRPPTGAASALQLEYNNKKVEDARPERPAAGEKRGTIEAGAGSPVLCTDSTRAARYAASEVARELAPKGS